MLNLNPDYRYFYVEGITGLQKYIEDGNYDIDNSLSERSIRPFTVGRSVCKGFTSEEGVMINQELIMTLIKELQMQDLSH